MEELKQGPSNAAHAWEFESFKKEAEHFNKDFPKVGAWQGVVVRENKELKPNYTPTSSYPAKNRNTRTIEAVLLLGHKEPYREILVHLYSEGDAEEREEVMDRLKLLYQATVSSRST